MMPIVPALADASTAHCSASDGAAPAIHCPPGVEGIGRDLIALLAEPLGLLVGLLLRRTGPDLGGSASTPTASITRSTPMPLIVAESRSDRPQRETPSVKAR
jgi:hypothetical protein